MAALRAPAGNRQLPGTQRLPRSPMPRLIPNGTRKPTFTCGSPREPSRLPSLRNENERAPRSGSTRSDGVAMPTHRRMIDHNIMESGSPAHRQPAVRRYSMRSTTMGRSANSTCGNPSSVDRLTTPATESAPASQTTSLAPQQWPPQSGLRHRPGPSGKAASLDGGARLVYSDHRSSLNCSGIVRFRRGFRTPKSES